MVSACLAAPQPRKPLQGLESVKSAPDAAYLCMPEDGILKSGEMAPNRIAEPPDLGDLAIPQAITNLRREPIRSAAGVRFRGNLGPSLFMTAVEARDQQQQSRLESEALGRRVLAHLAMPADKRAANDLPPRQSLREALKEPTGRFRDLLVAGLSETIAKGTQAAAAAAADHLKTLAATALVPCAKSAQGSEAHGWKGLTAAGRRAIRDAGAVMDDAYGSLAFTTATLTEGTAEVATRDQVATFQQRLLFLVRRRLVRLGLSPHVVLVCEMHPGRRAMDGALVPHWHGIVRVSPSPFATWRFRKEDWNRCVLQAYRIAFGHARGHTQRLAMLPQKTGAARYLAKYMAKGRSAVEALRGTQAGRMVPKQWWTWTGEVRELVKGCRLKPPSAFLGWCCRWWRELTELGDVTSSGPVQIGEDGAEVGRWFVWASEAALDRALEGWIGDELVRIEALSTG